MKFKFYTLFGTHYCLASYGKDCNYITTAPTYIEALEKAHASFTRDYFPL